MRKEIPMRKHKARKTREGIEFEHFRVVKKGHTYWAVETWYGQEITSGTSFGNATKKANLLETGYSECRETYFERS